MNSTTVDFSEKKQAYTAFRIGQRRHQEAESRAGAFLFQMRKEGKKEWHGIKSLEMLLKMDNRTLRKLFSKKHFWQSQGWIESSREHTHYVLVLNDSTFEAIDKTVEAFKELEKMNKQDIIACRYVFMHLLRCKS